MPIALGSHRRLAAFSQMYRHAPIVCGRYFSAGTREVRDMYQFKKRLLPSFVRNIPDEMDGLSDALKFPTCF
jgi:hypothetical protein